MLKDKELRIISFLRQNARMGLTEMSRKTGIPISTIYETLKANSGGLIKKITCIVDFRELGFNVRANIMLSVRRDQRDKLVEFLMRNANVNSLYRINNGYDLLVEGIFRSIGELEEFLDRIEAQFRVKGKQVFYIIEDIKREEFMSEPGLNLTSA